MPRPWLPPPRRFRRFAAARPAPHSLEGVSVMTTASTCRGAPTDPAAVAQHLDAIAAALANCNIGCRIAQPGGTPVLTTGPPTEPNTATVAIDPDMHAGPDLRLDFTCVWAPPLGATPQATARVIAAVLNATRFGSVDRRQPAPADATRLADFLRRHLSWSAYWDSRYGLWRAAEDDPASALYVETPELDVVMTYITSHS
jgi:hypothetical protein